MQTQTHFSASHDSLHAQGSWPVVVRYNGQNVTMTGTDLSRLGITLKGRADLRKGEMVLASIGNHIQVRAEVVYHPTLPGVLGLRFITFDQLSMMRLFTILAG